MDIFYKPIHCKVIGDDEFELDEVNSVVNGHVRDTLLPSSIYCNALFSLRVRHIFTNQIWLMSPWIRREGVRRSRSEE